MGQCNLRPESASVEGHPDPRTPEIHEEDNMRYIRTSAAVATAFAFALTGAALPADAARGEVIRQGDCSGTAHWKLKAKPDNGRLEVEGEVDANRNGQMWNWKILRNGNVVAQGSATTHAPSGSFTVQRRIGNPPGSDRIGWRAKNPATGQTCRGGLTI
jgi:hypothetical protein